MRLPELRRCTRAAAVAAAIAALPASIPSARAMPAAEDAKKGVEDAAKQAGRAAEREDGWDGNLSLGASLNFTDNQNVVGKPSGFSLTVGGRIDGETTYVKDRHQWSFRGLWSETFSRTPSAERFVKTKDNFELHSAYHFFVQEWWGAFGSVGLNTNVFPGGEVTGERVDFRVTRLDGTVENRPNGHVLRTTDPFRPMNLAQTFGLFARPLDREPIHLEFTGGFGAREVFAKDQVTVTGRVSAGERDDPDATRDLVRAQELEGYVQGGAVFTARANGQLKESRVSYDTGMEVMFPLLRNPDPVTQNTVDLTNLDVWARLSFQLVEWASLDYEFRLRRRPQLIDAYQITNSLLLTFGYTAFEDEG